MIYQIQQRKKSNQYRFTTNLILSIIEDDVNELNRVISLKSSQIKKLRFKLQQFKQHIIDEEDMSLQFQTHFYQKQHQN
ncbi:unnamed protein product [Paramecium primaurelia]|uniref:Uncharacterized protein n=1 Tax=Paramecium primaurelia TaxID=5886 RepID=A0A8S1MN77_PARPR|nr:unnamed protein product [Paramecium primaurelia]